MNAGIGKIYFDLKPDELKCLPHDEYPNFHNPRQPSRLYHYDECAKLAFRKEAMLSGVSEEDVGEDEMLERGKKLFTDKHAGG